MFQDRIELSADFLRALGRSGMWPKLLERIRGGLEYSALIFISFCLSQLLFVKSLSAATTYTNPIIDNGPGGIADPDVIKVGNTYYLYPTQDSQSIHVWTSKDLVAWTQQKKAIFDPRNASQLWAPGVFRNPTDEKYYLYYSLRCRLGVAVCSIPNGEFKDKGYIYPDSTYFCMDGMLYTENGRYYLYYCGSQDDNTAIYVQEMQDPAINPTGKIGSPVLLFGPTSPWETNIEEGPYLYKNPNANRYYLMYSGCGASDPRYAIGYATSNSPMGPFTKYPNNPIALNSGNGVVGPGHHCLAVDGLGKLWFIYQQNKNPNGGWYRQLGIDPVWFDSNGVMCTKLTRGTLQTAPGNTGSHSLESGSMYVAENALLSGGAHKLASSAYAVNGKGVGGFENIGAKAVFTHIDGGAQNGSVTVGVSYANGAGVKSMGLLFNGIRMKDLNFPSTGDWGVYTAKSVRVSLTLNPGKTNNLTLIGKGKINIDYIQIFFNAMQTQNKNQE